MCVELKNNTRKASLYDYISNDWERKRANENKLRQCKYRKSRGKSAPFFRTLESEKRRAKCVLYHVDEQKLKVETVPSVCCRKRHRPRKINTGKSVVEHKLGKSVAEQRRMQVVIERDNVYRPGHEFNTTNRYMENKSSILLVVVTIKMRMNAFLNLIGYRCMAV